MTFRDLIRTASLFKKKIQIKNCLKVFQTHTKRVVIPFPYVCPKKQTHIINTYNYCLGTYLFFKIPRPGDSERPFRSSSQAAIYNYYQSNHSKVEAISLSKCHAQEQANMPANLHTISFLC